MTLFVGDDWAEDHHDIHLMDAEGTKLASRRLPEGLAGIRGFHELVAAHAEDPPEVVIGIETDRGLWVQALAAAGYQVFAVNPLAVARYRDRHHVSGAKSDATAMEFAAETSTNGVVERPFTFGQVTRLIGHQRPAPTAHLCCWWHTAAANTSRLPGSSDAQTAS